MWWPPESENEAAVRDTINGLLSWYRTRPYAEGHRVCWGVGSALLHGEQLVPLVLLNAELFGVPKDLDTALQPFRLDEAKSLPQSWLPPREFKLPVYGLIVARPSPATYADELLAEQLALFDPIVCDRSGQSGTAGVAVWDAAIREFGLLTAGHVFPHGFGSRVSRRHDGWGPWHWWPRRRPLGQVSHHVVPAGKAGWDAAVIRLDAPGGRTQRPSVGPLLTRLDRLRSVVTYGAFSGFVDEAAFLSGAIVEGGAEQIEWKNCWMLAPSGVLAPGDSGAAVFARDNLEFLGTYVGRSKFASEKAIIHYVQDAATLQRDVLSPWDISFR